MSQFDSRTVLIANRGEIAVRVIRTLSELGWRSVTVYTEDDRESLHVLMADTAVPLKGSGVSAYLDSAQLISIAVANQCDAIHPGYGFLSENPEFARACESQGITFIGPDGDTLSLFGDKGRARALAKECGVPVLAGQDQAVDMEQARTFLRSLPAGSTMVIKAVSGGGGRGMRLVQQESELEEAMARCRSEAKTAFGDDAVYVEEWVADARHIEVQVLGDGEQCCHLLDRECTLQRRHQKLIEIAPAVALPQSLREQLYDASLRMARATRYRGLCTFEFLVFSRQGESRFVFIEANPRVQVEHTVTEAVTGLDLIALQLAATTGTPVAELAISAELQPKGYAIQARINAESLSLETGSEPALKPSAGLIRDWNTPSGPGIRIDTYVYSGYRTSSRYDSLLAKLVIHTGNANFSVALRKLQQALREFRISGVHTNVRFLQALLQQPEVQGNEVHTRFIDQNLRRLATDTVSELLPQAETSEATPITSRTQQQDSDALLASMPGSVIQVQVEAGETVHSGQPLLILDAMKMEHVIAAPYAGIVETVWVKAGDAVVDAEPLLKLVATGDSEEARLSEENADPDTIRPDLQEVIDRHGFGFDENRPDAVAKRRATGQRTARENIADLCDDDSFVEYGSLVIAAQRRRRSLQDLMEKTPGDGMVTGLGRVNGDLFGAERSRCVVMTYDYTVMAGTQGIQNHHKKDRMFELAERLQVPVVLFSEGGGGRPGDTDGLGSSASLDCLAFLYFARLSALVPLVGIASGRSFAGNAALLGCCDVVIATRNANIGMGGPAMIEGGGLGVFKPEQVGPASTQFNNGVIDVLVDDEAQAVRTAKQYLSYFQGPLESWERPDQRVLRHLIPENRRRIYDVRKVIDQLFDVGSVLELRQGFGQGMVTALARVEGRPLGVIANNPGHLAGAIDAEGADKAARFMQLCDAFDLPILFLCDTPGIMVGPQAEETALVRHAARLFVTAASLSVPFFTIVLRKAYGLGAMTMAGGTLKAPVFTVSWPTGEFGAMGLEGAVKLGFRKELEAESDPASQQALYEKMVAEMYERGKAVNTATFFEFDDVIDPADSRRWIVSGLEASIASADTGGRSRNGKKRPCIDTW